MQIRRLFLSLITLWMLAFGPQALAAGQDFYWKASYGRGVGTVPDLVCPSDKIKAGALCYDKCRGDFEVSGLSCAAPCPHGYDDRGPTCHWKGSISYVPEAHWDNCATKTKRTCTDWGFGNKTCVGGDCIGGLKTECRDDYKNVAGVCWFDGNVPRGFSGTNLDPIKPSYPLPNPTAMVQVCKGDKNLQDGLCYEACRKGYHGIGPVCWGNTPPGYVDCFTGYAKNQMACGSVMGAQTAATVTLGMLAAGPAIHAAAAARLAKFKEAEIKAAMGGEKEIAKLILENPKVFGEFVSIVGEAVSKSNTFKLGDALVDFLKPCFGGTAGAAVFKIFAGTKFGAAHAGLNPAEFFNAPTLEEKFQRTRDVLSFFALSLSIATLALPPTPTPSPLDVASAVFDATSSFLYTVYGE